MSHTKKKELKKKPQNINNKNSFFIFFAKLFGSALSNMVTTHSCVISELP